MRWPPLKHRKLPVIIETKIQSCSTHVPNAANVF